jgi:TPR repeat protein
MKLFRFLLALLMCIPNISHASVDRGQPQDFHNKTSFITPNSSAAPSQGQGSICSVLIEQESGRRQKMRFQLTPYKGVDAHNMMGTQECLRLAAQDSNADAQYLLAMMLMSQSPNTRIMSFAESYEYLKQAASQGHSSAQEMMSRNNQYNQFISVIAGLYLLPCLFVVTLVR